MDKNPRTLKGEDWKIENFCFFSIYMGGFKPNESIVNYPLVKAFVGRGGLVRVGRKRFFLTKYSRRTKAPGQKAGGKTIL